MAALKPAYLIHGDDHGAVAERRAGLRALGEGAQGDAASVEVLEGDSATPARVAQALSTMTLATGRRVIIVEGVERWRDADVEQHLEPAMTQMPPDTTLALFGREEQRAKAPAALHEAVKRAGGQVVAQMTMKPWELPGWARQQGARIGISIDAAAAKALVAQVGERQQRLMRELEKLALEGDAPEFVEADEGAATTAPAGAPAMTRVTVGDIERRAARSAQWRAYGLTDALLGGERREATFSYLRLRGQGERLSGLTYLMAQRLRDALAVALRLRDGESVAEVKRGMRMPARAAERFLADVGRTDPDRLRQALVALAALEVDSRGGAVLSRSRAPLAGMSEDTLALQAIETMTDQR
jgi:DNA polymerase-3 subunit delta